jgi:hypothetical protein
LGKGDGLILDLPVPPPDLDAGQGWKNPPMLTTCESA